MLGSALSALVALSFLGLGAGALAAPRALSENYGLPVEDATSLALVRALGMRDAALGLLVAWCLTRNAKGALGATLAVSAFVAGCDFSIVAAARGAAARKSLTIHGGGCAGLLCILAALRYEL